jgi:molybdopterin synthase sulfur carrier subunit
MKIRIKTFAQIKDILGADSFLEFQDGTSMRELLKALRERAGKSEDHRRPAFFQSKKR